MRKQDVPTKIRVQWTIACERDPSLRVSYGDDGWQVWRDLAHRNSVAQNAQLFMVARKTIYRWQDELQKEVA